MAVHVLAVLAVYVVVLFLPGAAVAVAGGLRAPLAIAAAPLITYGLATATGTAAALVDLSWGPWLLGVEAAVLSALLGLFRLRGRLLRLGGPHPGRRRERIGRERIGRERIGQSLSRARGSDLVIAVGVIAGGLVSMVVLFVGFGGIDRPNQDWDYTFHANATRFIADTGEVAPSALRAVNDWDSTSFFYPNAYHAIGAVVRGVTGAPIFDVLNAQTLLIGAIAGLGLAVLLREIGAPTAVSATTPVLLAGFASFPYDVIWRGPLLPYATGLALVPACLLVVRALLDARRAEHLILAALCGAALFGLQPSTALSAGLLILLMVGQRWVARRRIDPRELGLLSLTGALVVILAAPEVLGSVRASTGGPTVDWPAVDSPVGAIVHLLFLSPGVDPGTHRVAPGPQLWLAGLVVVGLLTLRSARYLGWWLAGAGLAFALFVVAASSDSVLAESLTRPWWNDRWRFAALAVLGMAPLAAHGLWRLSLALAAGTARLRARVHGPASPARRQPVTATLVLLLAGVVLLSGGLYAGNNSRQVATAYQSQRYLDSAETTAMRWLGQRIRSGETVMNDPGDGSAYMAAVAGIRPLFGQAVNPAAYATMGPRQRLLLDDFNCLDTDVHVRHLIDQLDIRYVFLGSGFARPGMKRARGLQRVWASPSLDVVYARSGVQIYRVRLKPRADRLIPACHGPSGTPSD